MPVALADAPIYSWRGRIGVIVPPTNTVNEAEWNMMAPPGLTIHAARMALHTDTTSTKGKRALRRDLRKACADLAQAGVDVIAYGCTAGSMVSPVTDLSDFMTDVSGLPAVTTAGSLIAALRALGAARISVATPYHDALNEHERAFLAAHGIETLRLSGLGFGAHGPEEYKCIARVPAERVYELACSVDHKDADAVLVSCTDFPTLDVIPRLERDLGKPAVSSNQATFWAALRAAGLDLKFDNFGTLLRDH